MNAIAAQKPPSAGPWAAFWTFLATGVAVQAQFTPGNLAVLRLGDGAETLTNSGNTVFIDQYSSNGAAVSSVRIPDLGTSALVLSGVAGSEGQLTRAFDRTVLCVAGYHVNRGTIAGSLSSQTGSLVPRGFGTVDAAGIFELLQTSKTVYSGNNIRGAVTDGTNHFWTAGAPGGICFFQPPQAPVTNQASISSTRYVKIIEGSVYFSSQSGAAGLYTFASGGLPTNNIATNLLFATGAGSEPAGFGLNRTLTIAYVADQRTSAGGGIQKWTNGPAGWGLAYTLTVGTGSGAFAVAADFSGAATVLYATTTEASSNRLVCLVDTNASASATLLAVAGRERAFKGVDFGPDLRPEILSQPQSQAVATGSDVSFTVGASSPFALSYRWQRSGAALQSETNATLRLSHITFSDQGTYRVVVENIHGTNTSTEATLTVNPAKVLLAAQVTGANISLWWPTNALGFTLEADSDLLRTSGWSAVPQSIVVTNGLNSVTLPLSAQQQFFRLKQ